MSVESTRTHPWQPAGLALVATLVGVGVWFGASQVLSTQGDVAIGTIPTQDQGPPTTIDPKLTEGTESSGVDQTLERLGIDHHELTERFIGQHFDELGSFIKQTNEHYSVRALEGGHPYGMPDSIVDFAINVGRLNVDVDENGLIIEIRGWN